MNNTITIYPKTVPCSAPTPFDDKSDGEDLERSMINYECDFERFLDNQDIYALMGDQYLDIMRFIKRDDPDHHLYHQDDLSRELQHYHIELRDPISIDKFEGILRVLFRDDLITEGEKARLSIAYSEANLLTIASAKSEEITVCENTPIKKEATGSTPSRLTKTSSFSAGFFKLASMMLHTGMANIPSQPFLPPFR